MRILFFGNNLVGLHVLRWLKEQCEEVVGLVIHEPPKRKYVAEIIQAADLPSEVVFDGSRLHEAEVLEAIRALLPDIGLSILFDYILKPDLLSLLPRGVVNLHPALLPYNRGQYPNVWSIIEGTPSGVTLHYIDAGIDTGDIIAQREVRVEPVDTGETLYHKLEQASIELFRETWPSIKGGCTTRTCQRGAIGTYHRTQDVKAIDEIDLNRLYLARDLINILRARTFPPYRGAYFTLDGKHVYLRLQLEYDEEV